MNKALDAGLQPPAGDDMLPLRLGQDPDDVMLTHEPPHVLGTIEERRSAESLANTSPTGPGGVYNNYGADPGAYYPGDTSVDKTSDTSYSQHTAGGEGGYTRSNEDTGLVHTLDSNFSETGLPPMGPEASAAPSLASVSLCRDITMDYFERADLWKWRQAGA